MYYDITQTTYNGIYQNVHDTVYDMTIIFIEDDASDTGDDCTAFIKISGILSAYSLNEYPLS